MNNYLKIATEVITCHIICDIQFYIKFEYKGDVFNDFAIKL
jgi:hypothetical protein